MLFTEENKEGITQIYADVKAHNEGLYNGIIQTVAMLRDHHEFNSEAAKDVEITMMTTAHMALCLLATPLAPKPH